MFDRDLAPLGITRSQWWVLAFISRKDGLPQTQQARGFLEKLRKETDKFNAKIVVGIDRKQLENASDALLAMKHNLLAMADGTPSESQKEDEEEVVQRTKTRKRRRAA